MPCCVSCYMTVNTKKLKREIEMSKGSISKKMYDFLIKHISEVEKQKDILIKDYYSEDMEESMNIEAFFRDYTVAINDYLDGVKGAGDDDTAVCPFVIIGSVVEVQDIDDKETYKYQIVPPFSKDAVTDTDCASCLSPLGKSLLLKSINERVNVRIPTGVLRYLIKDIRLPEQLCECDTVAKKQGINIQQARQSNTGLKM
jgi:transcription elongation factor GreA